MTLLRKMEGNGSNFDVISNVKYPISNAKKMREYDIHERIFKFVILVLSFLNKLPKTSTNIIIINQITRSVTSVGANDQEADGALTNRDFIHGLTIVRKEGKEAVYWLRVISEMNKQFSDEITEIVKEGREIVAIVSKIILNTSKSTK